MTDNFLLRKLAGRYFLVKKNQKYPDYRKPVEMDESGAQFWRALCRFPESTDRAARCLCEEYGISMERAREDLEEFRQEILKQML